MIIQSTIRSEEHTSELQSLRHLVCRLLLEKNKKKPCTRRTARARLADTPGAMSSAQGDGATGPPVGPQVRKDSKSCKPLLLFFFLKNPAPRISPLFPHTTFSD